MIEKYLDDLESRIIAGNEEDLLSQWKGFYEGSINDGLFLPGRKGKSAAGIEWPQVLVNDALDDLEKMALQQFCICSKALEEGSGDLMAVRCNYGTSILPSVFGAELFIMERSLDTLPTSWPLKGGCDAVKSLLEAGVPDVDKSLGAKTFEMGQYLQEIIAKYPMIGKYVDLYHPDLQGPMDVCEVLWGSSIFYELVDKPEMVKDFLELITETYICFMNEWQKIVPHEGEYSTHWLMLHPGQIMLRDDSVMNLSPEMFDEFIRPYDQRLLTEFGGGVLHFCGRGDHFIEKACRMEGLCAIAMSQPELNDMEIIYKNTVDKGIKLLGLKKEAAEQAISEGRDLKGNVYCWL